MNQPTSGATILLVEDEELNRTLVRAILARSPEPRLKSARLVEAETLSEARARLTDTAIDVILLDVQLPDGTGLSLAKELTDQAGGQRPAIIALTAGVLPEQREAAMSAGCDAILEKPYPYPSLLSLLLAHLPANGRDQPALNP